MKKIFVISFVLVSALLSQAQTNAIPNLLEKYVYNNNITGFGYVTYVPSLNSKWGGGVGGTWKSSADSLFSTEVRLQYLNISKQEGQLWQPNALELVPYKVNTGRISITPFVEIGAAVDSRCHPYLLTGAGATVGYDLWYVFAGIERWVGPFDAFTTYQFGVGKRF